MKTCQHPTPNQRLHSSQSRLGLALWTQSAFFVVELVVGILSGSLALLADAGHMFSDVAALGLSLLALSWAERRPTAQKTFGYRRLEILVALINGLVLWAMAGYIFYEALGRLFHPREISGIPLVVVASLGLVVNLLGMYVLRPARERSLNLRSAFIHLLSDSFASFAAVLAGLAIIWRGWQWFDPLAGIVVGVLIVASSWQLVWEATEILMEATPRHIDLAQVQRALEGHPDVKLVHDLHVWTIASGIFATSVHVTVDHPLDRDCLTWELEEILRHRFGLEHNTIQIEGPDFHDPQVCPLTRLEELTG
ncbi:MAG: cation diffusion facilitator family transporter [Desulfobaccales bacterium]